MNTVTADADRRRFATARLTPTTLRWLGAVVALTAATAVAVRYWWAADLTAALAPYISSDGVVTAQGVARLESVLQRVAICAGLVALLLIVVAPTERRQSLGRYMTTDEFDAAATPIRTLFWTSAISLSIVALWQGQGFAPIRWLLMKEGPLEHVTAILLLASAGYCAIAARHWSRRPRSRDCRVLAWILAILAVGSFVVGMEEISWGQHLLGFRTPDQWAQLNYQHEMTLHNLVDRDTLTRSSRLISVLIVSVVGALSLLAPRIRSGWLRPLLPHPALLPLAIGIGVAGTMVHPEAAELLIAAFAFFYSVRARRVAAGSC